MAQGAEPTISRPGGKREMAHQQRKKRRNCFVALLLARTVHVLRGWRQLTIGKATRRLLGLARVAEKLAFQRIEAMGGREETIAAGLAHDDSRRLGADFDDVGVRHRPTSDSVRANNGAGGKKFRAGQAEIGGSSRLISCGWP